VSRASYLPDLSGTVAVVTGAGGGIGGGIARQFALAGAAVVVHYRTSAGPAQAMVEEIQSSGGRAIAVRADLRDEAACRQLFADAMSQFGRVDALVSGPDSWALDRGLRGRPRPS
jgi:NAD(P)-dependent dehydrogenase (short-subunit alcohol dehydrogenase family)